MPLPAVAIAPATSSRYFEAAAIMARTESLTVEGACPSAQLIEPSGGGVVGRGARPFPTTSLSDLKSKRPLSGPRSRIQSRVGSSAWTYQRAAITHMVR